MTEYKVNDTVFLKKEYIVQNMDPYSLQYKIILNTEDEMKITHIMDDGTIRLYIKVPLNRCVNLNTNYPVFITKSNDTQVIEFITFLNREEQLIYLK